MRTPWPCLALSSLVVLLATAPARADLAVQGGIGFVAVTGASPGGALVLETRRGKQVGSGTADTFGSLIFRDLTAGGGYAVRDATSGASLPATVLSFNDVPDQSFYQQQSLTGGFQYIEMRDGTLLAATVRPPLGKTMADGPFPTVVEYSGYATADPNNPQPVSLLASALGYATVGVNMRGSGCSGGVFDLFDLPTTADGYDIVEAVAAQPWVQNGKVGLIGISFSGISQLFVGGARPPHLMAMAPLSVIADIYRSPGFPGGIFNSGFAGTWLQDRANDARPAPQGGQQYAIDRVNAGDQTCLANQRLRLQTQDPVQQTHMYPFYTPSVMDNRSPINWVHNIEVPTFLGDSWQDEQTGGDFASMLFRFPRRPDVKFNLQNGVHASPLEPDVLYNWIAFLDLYVAGKVPDPGRVAPIAPIIYPQILGPGAPIPPLPADRFDSITDYSQARALFESDPTVRIFMENGAGTPTPGLPAPTFELGFRRWPVPNVRPSVWYMGPGGTLDQSRPSDNVLDGFHPDPDARPAQTLPGTDQDSSWVITPPYDWRPYPAGTAVAYATLPLDEDVTIVGPGSVDLWLRSSAADTDLQVTLTEIRPDGLETYVQSGWLRASMRHLDSSRSSKLDPRPTYLERDAAPLPPGKFSKVRIALFAVAHVFRAGSRIRISVEAPGDDRTRWSFVTPETDGSVLDEISSTRGRPSRLVLGVVPDVVPPPTLPPCPGLRAQPCRTYVPTANGG
jgi:predicted acyl esterase